MSTLKEAGYNLIKSEEDEKNGQIVARLPLSTK